MTSPLESQGGTPVSNHRYIVVARRYRPQSFDELVGQDQAAQGLCNAIASHRVGHAYLFTGARGVGKTSTARIFAKALNCEQGPTAQPCNACDICLSIASGDDVDVLEIDGASNRGIDEIRQLRSTISVRPSRGRFKVYIIDEVHMLTKEAFNALLKTLEEPPNHVKFIFCTTDPEKIPITVLSRCQRFDFPPVETNAILERLRHIAEAEGVQADDDALRLLARRANGSLRDSQSLLEQLLSFASHRITVADVNAMLGTADREQLLGLVEHLQAQDAAAALTAADQAIAAGVDPSQLTEQLAGAYRDMMAAAVGCSPDLMLHTSTDDHARLAESGRQFGASAILGIMQVLDETLVRMRTSPLARTLLEVALVRICHVGQLQDVADAIARLGDDGAPPPAAQKKTNRPEPAARLSSVNCEAAITLQATTPSTTSATASSDAEGGPWTTSKDLAARPSAVPRSVAAGAPPDDRGDGRPSPALASAPPEVGRSVLDATNAESIWREALASLGQDDLLAEAAGEYDCVAISGPNQLAVHFREGYNWHMQRCDRPDTKALILEALHRVAGRPIRLDFVLREEGKKPAVAARRPSHRQLARDAEKHPLVSQAVELFGAEVVRVVPRDHPAAQ